MKPLQSIGLIVILLVLSVSSGVFYTIDQTKVGILLQLGKPVGGVKRPGLHMKIPLVQTVVAYDVRLQAYDAAAREVITRDKKNLKVDNYARWRIEDPLLFYQAVRDVAGAQARLDDIIYSLLREQFGKYDLIDIVATSRTKIMADVTEAANLAAKSYGISVGDVRIKRADLPDENARHVYDRMRAERTRQAKRYRAEGDEISRRLRSEADKERDIILAEAYKTSQQIRGEGDAESTKIYAEAYNKDPEFYAFVKSLEVYLEGIKDNDILLLSPSDPLFQYMKSERPNH